MSAMCQPCVSHVSAISHVSAMCQPSQTMCQPCVSPVGPCEQEWMKPLQRDPRTTIPWAVYNQGPTCPQEFPTECDLRTRWTDHGQSVSTGRMQAIVVWTRRVDGRARQGELQTPSGTGLTMSCHGEVAAAVALHWQIQKQPQRQQQRRQWEEGE